MNTKTTRATRRSHKKQESVSRPKNVKVVIDQINELLEEEKFMEAEKMVLRLKDILGEDNSEYKKMAGVVEDAKMIWES